MNREAESMREDTGRDRGRTRRSFMADVAGAGPVALAAVAGAGIAAGQEPPAGASEPSGEGAQPPASEKTQPPTAPAPEAGSKPRIIEGSPYPTFSRAVVFGGVAYVAGVVGQKSGSRELVSSEFEPQCRQAMENLQASVIAAGSSMDRVLKCTAFLTDAADFPTFNRVYTRFFPTNPPARSTVVVKALVVPGAKLEIDCLAAVK